MKFGFYIIIFLLSGHFLFSQNREIDSLLIVLKTSKADTNLIKTLNQLSRKNSTELVNYKASIYYANRAKQYAQKLLYKSGLIEAHNNLALTYREMEKLPEALQNYKETLLLSKEIKSKKKTANAYLNIGLIYYKQANYIEALKNYFSALKLYEELDIKKGIAQTTNNIGAIYRIRGDLSEALKYNIITLGIRERLGEKFGVGDSYNNIGIVYSEQGNSNEALKNYLISLKIFEKLENKERIADIYNNLGAEYDALCITNKKTALKKDSFLNQSLNAYFTSLKLYQELDSKGGMAMAYNNIGGIKIKLNKIKEGKLAFEKGLVLSYESGNVDDIKESFKGLAAADSLSGNYEGAFRNYKRYIIYRDSLFNEENTKKSVQYEMQYSFAKKTAADSVKVAEEKKIIAVQLKQEKTQRFALYGGLSLVLVFAAFMFNRFRITQKQKHIIEAKEKETQSQNIIITQQKYLVEEKHKEITDSINYAERIQRSFLATKEFLNENLNDYFVFFQPKDVVSGDFYWASKLNNNQFALVIADSTGHGVPGAIMSLLNITSLEKAVESNVEPLEILNATRKTIIERLKKDGSLDGGKDGMDCSLISFDFQNNRFSYAAANNPVWIVRRSEILEFAPDKMPVGKHDKDTVSFSQHTIELQKGDMVYAITDGMPDQFGGPRGKKFMYKQLKELLMSMSGESMETQKEALKNTLNNWKGNLEQVDDVTIIGVRI